MTSYKSAHILLLLAIVAVALGLRLWGIGFGLPHAYHVDEPAYMSAALNLGDGVIGRQPNPTGFTNILFGEYALYYLVGRVSGLFGSTADFANAYENDPSIFLLLARLTTVTFGTLTVLVVYGLGALLRNRRTGLLAAFFLAVTFLHVRDSHYGVPDIGVAFFVSLTVLLSLQAIRQPDSWRLYLAAFTCGFAIAMKWSMLPLVVPVVIVIIHNVRTQIAPSTDSTSTDSGQRMLWRRLRAILLSLLPLAIGFGIGGFQLFLRPMRYLRYALVEATIGEAGGFGLWQIDTVPGWLFYLKTFYYGLGTLLLAVALIGVCGHLLWAIRTRTVHDILLSNIVLLAFPILYYLSMGATRHYFARYALPLVPFLVLFAAEAVTVALSWQPLRRPRVQWAATAILVSVLVAQPLIYSIRHNILLTRVDTRTIAKAWIEEHIPAGAKIAVDWAAHSPPLATSERVVPASTKLYDVHAVGRRGLPLHPLDWYREQQFDYLIVSNFIASVPFVRPRQDELRQLFYASLDQELTLLQTFTPTATGAEPPFIFDEIYGPVISLWQRQQPGPVILIYQLEQTEQTVGVTSGQ